MAIYLGKCNYQGGMVLHTGCRLSQIEEQAAKVGLNLLPVGEDTQIKFMSMRRNNSLIYVEKDGKIEPIVSAVEIATSTRTKYIAQTGLSIQ